MNHRLLATYLNDHYAASVGAVQLARRAAGSNRGTAYGEVLSALATEIDEDRATLRLIMQRLDIPPDRVKAALAWSAEKLGRLKLNGQLSGYSPLSRVVELEALALGINGKLALWRTLDRLPRAGAELADFDLPELIRRAERQLEQLETHRLQAVTDAFGAKAPSV